ncbi:hypothetical protein [Burkholderia savannae]|uniref:hypothetical protein n=1 Tax=Burkholderia savannae TaxID=1637837 RepID=UPI000AA10D5A|nr:hypothetical protein [Burkholderia savannae]
MNDQQQSRADALTKLVESYGHALIKQRSEEASAILEMIHGFAASSAEHPATAPIIPTPADKRAAFEAWWTRDVPIEYRSMLPLLLQRNAKGEYDNPRCEGAWEIWQASAAASPAAEAVAQWQYRIVADLPAGQWHNCSEETAKRLQAPEYAADHEIRALYAALQRAQADKRHVGDSKFEGWYADYAAKGETNPKQIARDAYAAGMGDTTPQPAQADALDEDAYVAKRMAETLATVYTTIIGDDEVDTDDSLNAIERVVRAAQVLRLEVDLYRSQADARAEAREPVETEQSIAADCYHWIAERIGTKDGCSVQEHVDAMCQVIDECADFFHDFVGTDEGGDDEAVRIARNIRALKAGTIEGVSTPADAGEGVTIYQTNFIKDQWRDVDRAEYDRAKGLRPDLGRIVYTAPPDARMASLTDEQRSVIENAMNCLDAAVMLIQDWYDGEPGPASQWDARAHQLVRELRAILNGGDHADQA